jgi:hypothetical protein
VGDSSGPEGLNDSCGKMMHMGTMDRGFPVDVVGVISFYNALFIIPVVQYLALQS